MDHEPSVMKQVTRKNTSSGVIRQAAPLALYDRYGAMAYGIILRIIPDAELAQTVLVDLFSSSPLNGCENISASELIRLARAKALSVKPQLVSPAVPISVSGPNDTLPNVVFNLSFCQGYSLETIAQKLQVSQTNVLKFIQTYFKNLRSS